MVNFWNFSKYANELIPVPDGIKISKKRGFIGNTWQSMKWVELIEFHGDYGRMARGRTYARKGQIIELIIEQGKIISKVQGSFYNPYKIEIDIPIFSKEIWDKAIKEMSKKAIFMAKMLVCEVPEEISAIFDELGVSLIPKSMNEIYAECTCLDYGDPCKHIAAIYYLLAELMDSNQFLFLFLRGCDDEELIKKLRIQRNFRNKENFSINEIHSNRYLRHYPKEISSEELTLKKYMENFWGNEIQDLDQLEFVGSDFDNMENNQFENIDLSIRGHELKEVMDKIHDVVVDSIILKFSDFES
jgi:uncharacterized Zn finger protein